MAEAGSKESIIELYRKNREYYFGISLLLYERLVKLVPELPIKISEKDEKIYQKIIEDLHLDLTPRRIASALIFFSLFGLVIFFLVLLLTFNLSAFLLVSIIYGLMLYYFAYYPKHLYNKILRLKESQLSLAIFYIVSYMRLNPNLEAAIKFTAEYLPFPLKLDFLRILWLVETKRESSILDALDKYLVRWAEEAYYFVEAMELIVTVLYEPNPIKKDLLLDKALETMIDGVQLKMQRYVRELKGPIEATYMLGLVLPLLTITLLPLISAFMTEIFRPSLLFTIYNVVVPVLAFFVGYNILENRPGFSIYDDEIIHEELRRKKLKNISLSILAGGITFFILFFIASIALVPIIYEYNVLSLILSLFLILVFGISISVSALKYYQGVKEIKEKVVKINRDLPYILYHLANRIGEGLAVEHAFYRVYQDFKKKELGKFAYIVYRNVTFGYPLKDAILNPRFGALRYYPSSILKSAMQILLESSRRSPEVASRALIYISQYLSKLRNVDERIKDLLADVTSSMRVLISLMAPVMIGLIVGLSVMLVGILYGFTAIYKELTSMFTAEEISGMGIPLDLLGLFSLEKVMPPFLLQFVVGLYLLELTIILAFFLNRIENGYDSIEEKRYIGEYLMKSTILYVVVCGTTSVVLWQLALSIFQLFT